MLIAHRFFVFAIGSLFFFAVGVRDAASQDPISFPTELLSKKLLIKDTKGNPIVGASVNEYAMRSLEEPGSHFGWPSQNVGPAPSLVSDETGAVNILYPEKFGAPEKWQQTKSVTFYVSHSGYVPATFDLEIAKWPDEIKLTEGVSLEVTAKGPQGESLTSFFPMVGSEAFSTKWNLEKKSVAVTKSLKGGEAPCLVVAPNNGQTLFSQPLVISLEEDKANRLDLQLQPGKKIYGEFPSNVPRPILNGSVHLHAVLDFGKPVAETPSVYWDSYCDVNPDGTFELPNIPAPAQIQIIAICDGWLIESMDKDFFIKGKTYDLTDKVASMKVEFEMEETGDLTVEVMDPDGNSVVGAQVSTWPNQSSLSGYSTVLASKRKSLDWIERLIENKTLKDAIQRDERTRYSQVTDEEGRATLKSIPASRKQSLAISHPDYFLSKVNGLSESGYFDFTPLPGEEMERLIIMEKRVPPPEK